MKLVLITALLFISAQTFSQTALTYTQNFKFGLMTIKRSNPNYEDGVLYRLIGKKKNEEFAVYLQKLEYLPKNASTRTLTKVGGILLFTDASLKLDGQLVPLISKDWLKMNELSISSVSGYVSFVEFKKSFFEGVIKSSKLKKIFPKDFNGIVEFENHSYDFPVEYSYTSKYNTSISNISFSERSCIRNNYGTFCGGPNTFLTVYGNEVAQIFKCDATAIKSDLNPMHLKEKGNQNLTLKGSHKGSCIYVTDDRGNMLLRTVLK